jgi:hypothetical protein
MSESTGRVLLWVGREDDVMFGGLCVNPKYLTDSVITEDSEVTYAKKSTLLVVEKCVRW